MLHGQPQAAKLKKNKQTPKQFELEIVIIPPVVSLSPPHPFFALCVQISLSFLYTALCTSVQSI